MHRYLNPAVVAVVMVLGFALPATPAEENDLQLASPESVGMSTARGRGPNRDHDDPASGTCPLNIRPMFSNVVTQAVVDSLADQPPTIMGYATPH